MNLFRSKVTTPLARDSISRSPLRRGLILLALALTAVVFAMGTRTGNAQTPTPCAAPALTTSAASSITSSSATLNGTVNPNGCDTTAYFCYGSNINCPSQTANQTFTGNTAQNLTATISGLAASTTYHFQIVATNSSGSTRGSDTTFTTLSATAPAITTNPAAVSTTLSGTVNPHGLTTTVHFQYGTTTSYGSTTPSTTKTGKTAQNVSATIHGLPASTTYHFQIVATNSSGTAYGSDTTFTTP